ncbi:DUF2842 domain-containing protein [Sphingomonas alpina]|uniref:DUF2842 domain-containing protein n=2 Tax=Sphingomonas alpina TaxID=653931 RepID=A0A7H0LPI4_9SPHN|nr:DUF2842 domain-containing protein [Sphingomonas alpina]QNQ11587.1 DUF2842 domain-containing protein [Sphingomonas alpina]
MTPSWRKPVGMLAILAMITIWVILVATASDWVGTWHWLLQLVFYVVTGIIWLWILPMRRMLLWMETGRWRQVETGNATRVGKS